MHPFITTTSGNVVAFFFFFFVCQTLDDGTDVAVALQRLRANLLLQRRNYESAVSAFEALIDADPEDLTAVASLIVALAHIDIDRAEEVRCCHLPGPVFPLWSSVAVLLFALFDFVLFAVE